ncbi:MAG: hypothetical protein C4527_20245 [Candidatus Omnitrophota bacterium]|nr:MAG: hypothetical protein C4527_20245 [Candidatus Omnitrophota bacterium]
MKRTYRYTIVFEKDEDGVLIVSVPALPGCHSYGRTVEEAEQNIQEAILCYPEGLLEVGEDIPREKELRFPVTKPIQVSLAV